MKLLHLLSWAFGITSLCSGYAHAQSIRDYRCTVNRVAMAGSSQGKTLESMQKNYVGREFTVERKTGMMAGGLKNAYITRPEVVDIGSNENSYKVVTTLRREQGVRAGSNVHVLVINEYEKSPVKPFVFLDNDDVYFGTCVHF